MDFYTIQPVTLNLPITENILHFYIFKKTSFSVIHKLFFSQGVSTRSKLVILTLWGHLVTTTLG